MTPRKTWPLHVEDHRLEAIALNDRSHTIHVQQFELVRFLVARYPDEAELVRLAALIKADDDKTQRAKQLLQEAKRA